MRTSRVFPSAALAALILAGCGAKKEQTTTNTPPPPATPGVQPPGPPGPPPGTVNAGKAQAPGTALSAAKGNPVAGKAVFQANCIGCHGATGAGQMPGTPNFTSAAWWAKESDADLLKTIHNGMGKMPAWKGRLSEQQMKDALAYLHTFKK